MLFKTVFYLSGFDYACIKDILADIYSVDDTFIYDITFIGNNKNRIKLSIHSETEKQAYARGFWVKDKLNINSGFVVREVNE